MRILRYAQHPYRRSLMNDQVCGYTMLQHTIHRATTYEVHDSPADNVARKMSQFETDRLVTGRNGESFVHAQPSTLTRHVDARRTRRTTEKNSKDAATARSDVRATRMRYHRTWRAREGAK